MTEHLATIEVTARNLEEMIERATAPSIDEKPVAYLNTDGNEVRLIASSPGPSVASYCTFTEPFLTDVETKVDGNVEVMFYADRVGEYLDVIGGDDIVIDIYAEREIEEGERALGSRMVFTGGREATVFCPTSQKNLEDIYLDVTGFFDENDEGQSRAKQEPLGTYIRVPSSEMETIVRVHESDILRLRHYPVTVTDGTLLLEATDEDERDNISGPLDAHDVVGDDVKNLYGHGFKEVFKTSVDNIVDLWTEQGGALVVKQESDGATFRFVLAPIEQ